MVNEVYREWSKRYSDIAKLQWLYVVATIVLIVAAGLVALLNQSVSRQILTIASGAFSVFIVNLVVWSVVGPLVRTKRSTVKNTKQ